MYTKTAAVVVRRGREHWREVHQQQVRLIRQLESDDRRSQSLGLTEQSAEQCHATRFPWPSAWNTMYALVIYGLLTTFQNFTESSNPDPMTTLFA